MTRFALIALLPVAATVRASPPPIASRVLENGLTVLVAETHALPLVTVEIAVKHGAMTESPALNGLSHLYEHMFFKANAVIPNQEAFLARERELGILSDATTEIERVGYYATTSSNRLPETLAFMRDAITSPLFDQKELDRERKVIASEIDRREADPDHHFHRAVAMKVWWKHPSAKNPLGSRHAVLMSTREKMRAIQRRYYVPNNAALIVAGDAKPDVVFASAARVFAGWKGGADPFKAHPPPRHPPIPRTEVVLVEQPVGTVTATFTWHGPSAAGNEVALTYPADVLGFVTDEPSSRFQKALVDSGACIHASFGWYTQVNVGPIGLGLEAMPDKVDACAAAALAEVSRMNAADYLSDEELAAAALRAEVEQAREREKPTDYARALGFWWCSAGLDYYRTYVDEVRKVTRADVARFLDTYVLGRPYVFGVMLSPETAKEHRLDRAHFEALLGVGAAREAARR